MRARPTPLAAAVLAVALLAGTAACRGTRPLPATQVFRYAVNQEPETLDPALYTSLASSQILGAIFEGLLRLDPQTLRAVPAAAASYTVSPDGLTWRFTLRPGLTFSDGSPLTSDDFLYAFRRLLDPATAAEYAFLLFGVKGAKDFYEGKLADPAQLGLAAPDPQTLVITLVRPRPQLAVILCDPHLMPLRRKTVQSYGPAWTKPGNLVSNGPFLLADWRPYDRIELRPNPRYRERAKIRLQAVEIYPLDNSQTMLNYYLAGKLDWVVSLPLDRLGELSARPDYRQTPYLGVYGYLFNTRRPHLADARVRQALNLAVDKERLTRFVLKGGKIPAVTWVPSFLPGYRSPAAPLYNPARARQLLAQAGYGPQHRLPRLSVHFNTLEGNRKIAEVVQKMLAENLQVETVLEHQEWKVYVQRQKEGAFDLSRLGFEADYPDPANFLEIFGSGNSYNKTGWGSPTFDELLRRCDLKGGAARLAELSRAEEVWLQGMPALPLYFYSRTALLSPRVRGFTDNILDQHDFTGLWIEDRGR